MADELLFITGSIEVYKRFDIIHCSCRRNTNIHHYNADNVFKTIFWKVILPFHKRLPLDAMSNEYKLRNSKMFYEHI